MKFVIDVLYKKNIDVYGDVVMNYKGGVDYIEIVIVVEVDLSNWNVEVLGDYEISVWMGFNFLGCGDFYFNFKWKWYYFDGMDWDEGRKLNWIYKFRGIGKVWDWEVFSENGNYDYLMYVDFDFDYLDVVNEMKKWGMWYVNELNLDGFCLDVVKYIDYEYLCDWVNYVR